MVCQSYATGKRLLKLRKQFTENVEEVALRRMDGVRRSLEVCFSIFELVGNRVGFF